MTLTKTRCASRSYWCTSKGGQLSIDELLNLQGFDKNDVKWQDLQLKEHAIGKCIGNAQSLNVVMIVLQRLLFNANLITKAEYHRMHEVTGAHIV